MALGVSFKNKLVPFPQNGVTGIENVLSHVFKVSAENEATLTTAEEQLRSGNITIDDFEKIINDLVLSARQIDDKLNECLSCCSSKEQKRIIKKLIKRNNRVIRLYKDLLRLIEAGEVFE